MTQPISEVDELDRLFNMAINAKQVAVNTAQESDDLFEISEIKDVANALLDQYRTKFKADITALLHKAEVRARPNLVKYYDQIPTNEAMDWKGLFADNKAALEHELASLNQSNRRAGKESNQHEKCL